MQETRESAVMQDTVMQETRESAVVSLHIDSDDGTPPPPAAAALTPVLKF